MRSVILMLLAAPALIAAMPAGAPERLPTRLQGLRGPTRCIDPGPHSQLDVRLALLANEREPRQEPEVIPVAPAPPPPPLQRNRSIKLFSGADPAEPSGGPNDG